MQQAANAGEREAAVRIEELLRAEIATAGSISFPRFWDLALYHAEWGYYRRAKRIGVGGDFFTASQVQPVFGRLMARYCERLRTQCTPHLPKTLWELAPGRGEMRAAFADWDYRSTDVGEAWQAGGFRGVVFANELFDALPVVPGVVRADGVHEQRVTWRDDGFAWMESAEPDATLSAFAERWQLPREDGFAVEMHTAGVAFLEQLLDDCADALLVFLDYGYRTREWRRFRAGSLMAYRGHQALHHVLQNPGLQDLTAHVPFDVLAAAAEARGYGTLRLERLNQALLWAGEEDGFAAALDADDSKNQLALRQQLKLLLYGMGESFLVLVLSRKNNGPGCPGPLS